MVVRLLTSAIGLIFFFAAFYANELIFSSAIGLVSVIMVYEAVKALKAGRAVSLVSVLLSALGFASLVFAKYRDMSSFPASNVADFGPGNIIFWIIAGVLCYMMLSVLKHGKTDFSKIYSAAFITLYISLFMSFIILLRNDVGRYGVMAVFVFSWITDTGAYFTGSFLGKHKLAPELSPKKTVEGAIGGVVLTVIAAGVYMAIMKHFWSVDIHWLFLIAAAIGAVLAEIGDLAASAVKRSCNVKDFGWIFPGHGGMLDRFDSVVFIAPYVYFVFMLLKLVN